MTPPQSIADKLSEEGRAWRGDRKAQVLTAVGRRISQCGDMHIRVNRRTLRVIFRMIGLRDWEMGQDDWREIDALALDALRELAARNMSIYGVRNLLQEQVKP